ncbi:hypothetical protein HJ588_03510 [Flexivirga sp. ID2601S]|uniref:Copper resistance protein D domain-containing protein n=1 Tax=Flexivirga aerilata TaxID=1656889 RepID=A0A849ANG0_9MICO|nr:CopD family protein [Flexivirga aerilata]NNG38342.1 hypothetical protein [Flexivirga aerilata]
MIAGVTAVAADAATSGFGTVLLGGVRVLGYLGFVLLIGTTFFLTWLWPEGRVLPTFRRLIALGTALTVIATLVIPMIASGVAWSSYAGREGVCAFARISLVALGIGFAADVSGSTRRHRLVITLWQLAMIETYVLSSDAWGGQLAALKIAATTGHLAATAAWLGGLLALASVLIPSDGLDALHDVLPRFSVVAIVSVITLVVSGTLHALAVAGGLHDLIDSRFGTSLMVKVVVFGAMLLLGNVGRQYAGHAARRNALEIDETASPHSIQALGVAIGMEFTLAAGVLVATAVLVQFAPG